MITEMEMVHDSLLGILDVWEVSHFKKIILNRAARRQVGVSLVDIQPWSM